MIVKDCDDWNIDGDTVYFYKNNKQIDSVSIDDIIDSWIDTQ